jgi:cell division protein FtsQ
MNSAKIDPRIRERRIDVRRQRGRRRLRILIGVVIVGALAVLAVLVSRSALLDLDRITVEGVSVDRVDAVREASGLVLGEPLVTLDLAAAERAVVALPWVKTVDGSRRWPSTVKLTVQERQPIAQMLGPGEMTVLVDADGIAMSYVEALTPSPLPRIELVATGVLGDVQTSALPVLKLVQLVPDDLSPWIEAFVMTTDEQSLQLFVLDLVGSATADLGYDEDLPAKLEALRAVLGRVDRRCMAKIDLRVAELPSVTRDPICESQLP